MPTEQKLPDSMHVCHYVVISILHVIQRLHTSLNMIVIHIKKSIIPVYEICPYVKDYHKTKRTSFSSQSLKFHRYEDIEGNNMFRE